MCSCAEHWILTSQIHSRYMSFVNVCFMLIALLYWLGKIECREDNNDSDVCVQKYFRVYTILGLKKL